MNLFSLTKAMENPKVGVARIGKYIALTVKKTHCMVLTQ
jgi:hypothetical protein